MALQDTIIDYLLFQGFEQEIWTLALYSVGIAIYGLFIYFFYENLSRRNLLGDRLQDPDYGPLTLLVRGIRYLIVFPIVTFVFFMVLSFSFFFLSGAPTIDRATFVGQILLISMAIVTSVRITAYISEPTSHDIAKLLPLGLLGVYLVQLKLNVDVLEQTASKFRTFLDIDLLAGVVLRYFIFLVALEGVLRMIYLLVRPKQPDQPSEPAAKPGKDGSGPAGEVQVDRPPGREERPGTQG